LPDQILEVGGEMTPLSLQVDFRSPAPIYAQIVEQIQQQVLSGQLKPGDQLPTVRQLAAELRVNFNTVARAYRILDENGLISTQQGRGTYIWAQPAAAESAAIRQHTLRELANNYALQATALGYSPEDIRAALNEALPAPEEEA
jgi:GntR family transcriptional regulator